MQVKKSGIEAVEIPEHEVVTRRKQFRMKKDKAQARQTKKEQKAKDAEEKKALKETKKADREAKKLEKEAKKLEKQSRKSKQHATSTSSKAGRKAAEKLKERKNGKGKSKSTSKGMCSKKMIPKKDPNPAEGLPDDSSFPTWDSDEVFPVKSKQLSRFRHFQSVIKTSKSFREAKEDGEEKAEEKVGEKDEDMMSVEKKEKGKNTDQMKLGAKVSKKDPTKASKVTKETSTRKRKLMEKEDKVKPRRKTKQTKQDKEKKMGKKAKLSPKTPKTTPKRSRPRTLKPKKVHPVDEVAKELALKTLQECDTSGCCHPSFQQPAKIAGLEYSTYWSRGTVGVKVDRSFMNNKKAKGKGKTQIAYFGSNCACTYASWEIASLYVPR